MTENTTEHRANRPALRSLSEDGRPRVKVGSDPASIKALSEALDQRLLSDTYVRDGAPVVLEEVSGAAEVVAGDEDAPAPLRSTELRPALLARLLAEQAEVYRSRQRANGGATYDEEITPPRHVLESVLSRSSWPGLPVLHKVITTPVLRPDGTLLQTPGYDEATGYYLAGRITADPIPEDPTPAQVAEARDFLLGTFLRDFPWRTPADKANYLALLATPILHPFTRAMNPFGVVDATMPGSGKTILTSCVGLLVGQRVLTWTDSEEELRKSITTVLADQVGVIVFDNLIEGCVIDSAVLARLVTERVWTDRRLGTNAASSFANDRLWLATGNNLRTGGDMASRAVWVRLDPDCPHPEERTGFSIPNLDTWILDPANQAIVLRHLLVLILDWTRAGAPVSKSVPQMRQFSRWARYLGGLLEHHQVPAFLANHAESRDLDDDYAEWRAFLLRWHHLTGDRRLTAAELRASAEPDMGGLPDRWEGTFPTTTAGRLLSPKSLGRILTGQIGRWRGTVVLRTETDSHTKARAYYVERRPEKTQPATSKPAGPEGETAPANAGLFPSPESNPQIPQTPQNPHLTRENNMRHLEPG
ncbi:hypothetical protein ACIO3S_06495 [Nocardioides sp. NPDC087217]|uniref:hypothetical protein n=1 Tax=Nocardioides sp. NPDC087217 TaxID=3364335 RepID=UPI00382BD206